MPALKYLVRISMGPNEETFKICVELLDGTDFNGFFMMVIKHLDQAFTQYDSSV